MSLCLFFMVFTKCALAAWALLLGEIHAGMHDKFISKYTWTPGGEGPEGRTPVPRNGPKKGVIRISRGGYIKRKETIMAGIKGRSGGSRPGAGRPRKKKTISEKVKNNYLKAARELRREYGEPIEKAVLRLIYENKIQDSVKVAILKAYNEALLVKETEKDVNINVNQGQKIGLPEMQPDPAKLIPLQGGKE